MAKPKKTGAERKKKIGNLAVKDVETVKARNVTGGATQEFTITKYLDKATPKLF